MFLLKFKKAPSIIPATYNIKVTVEYADGKLESDAIECTFSSAIEEEKVSKVNDKIRIFAN